jgi:RNA polymerase sigma factor (sigma-70 family)
LLKLIETYARWIKKKYPFCDYDLIRSEIGLVIAKLLPTHDPTRSDWKTPIISYIKKSMLTIVKKSLPEREYFDQCLQRTSREDCTERVEFFLKVLDKRARFIIEETFLKEKTLGEVGKALGIGKERVRQLRNKALKRMEAHYVSSKDHCGFDLPREETHNVSVNIREIHSRGNHDA